MNTVTIKDIARMAGVSIATVSRTLNGGRGVSQETRTRILELCYQYGTQCQPGRAYRLRDLRPGQPPLF